MMVFPCVLGRLYSPYLILSLRFHHLSTSCTHAVLSNSLPTSLPLPSFLSSYLLPSLSPSISLLPELPLILLPTLSPSCPSSIPQSVNLPPPLPALFHPSHLKPSFLSPPLPFSLSLIATITFLLFLHVFLASLLPHPSF